MISGIPRWYKIMWGAWAALFFAVSVAYYTGAGGIRAGTLRISFERDRPEQLFRIDDSRAFLVEPHMISIVGYQRANPLLYVCGCFEVAARIANGVDRQRGPWVYTSQPGAPRYGADAVNLANGDLIAVSAARDDPAAREPLLARGLDPAAGDPLTPEGIAASHDALWVRKESCMDWLLAFYACGLLLLGLAPVALVQARRRARRTPHPG